MTTEAPVGPGVKVALLNGVCVRYDAISYSLRLKLDLLRSLRDSGHPVTVRAFVQGTDYEDPDIQTRSLHSLILDPYFSSADVLVYEFGIAYELFDSLFLVRDEQRSIGIYHNVTPLDLVDGSHNRDGVARGRLVLPNLAELDHVACDSRFNLDDLLACGVPAGKLSVLPLPPRASAREASAARWRVEPVEILFVGRLVRAKGIYDLLDAISLLTAEGENGFCLTLAGSQLFSDGTVVESIRSAADGATEVGIRLVSDPDDAALDELYGSSSVLVLPSHHEGYCLPVLEGFSAGCQVVAFDAGNLPTIVAGLGQIVSVGDTPALARALRRAIEATRAAHESGSAAIPTSGGALPLPVWRQAVAEHLARHTRAKYEQSFLELLKRVGVDLTAPGAVGALR